MSRRRPFVAVALLAVAIAPGAARADDDGAGDDPRSARARRGHDSRDDRDDRHGRDDRHRITDGARGAARAAARDGRLRAADSDPAPGTEPLVAIVRVTGDDDAAVLARIEGQTSDLDVTLRIVRERDASTARDADALAAAHRLAARHRARVVVWFRRDDDAWIVYVAQPEHDRVLIRRIATDGGKLAGSAAAEAAALVVRTALRALAAGGTIGVEEPEPAPAPTPVVEVVAPPPAPPPRTSAVRPLRPFAALLSRSVVDGAADLGQHGVSGRVGAAGGPFRVAAAVTYLPAISHRRAEADIDVTIEVERVDVGVALGMDLVGAASDEPGAGHPGWRITTELQLGVARYRRRTIDARDPLMATPDTATWAATVSPTARLARRLARGVWLELALGIDLIANAPEFGVVNTDNFRVHTRLWPAEPHAGVGILVDVF